MKGKELGEYQFVKSIGGWVYVGRIAKETEDELWIAPSCIVRKWGTNWGLGQLAITGRQEETVLDSLGLAKVQKRLVISEICCKSDIWEKTIEEDWSSRNVDMSLSWESKYQIVVAERGWVYVGLRSENKGDSIYLEHAIVLRKWGTEWGLGQLCFTGPTEKSEIDYLGERIRIKKGMTVKTLSCNDEIWEEAMSKYGVHT